MLRQCYVKTKTHFQQGHFISLKAYFVTRFGILDLQNRVTQNDVKLRVTNSKMFTEIFLSSY